MTTDAVQALLSAVEGAWSQPSPIDENGAHSGYRQVLVASGGHIRIPEAAALLEPFQPVREAWLSWIDPGGRVVEHIDAGPHFERWQIQLSEHGALMQDGERVAADVGGSFRVHHDRWHSVISPGPGARVVLVIDRDVVVSAARTPFVRR